jgi:hypothetical protein
LQEDVAHVQLSPNPFENNLEKLATPEKERHERLLRSVHKEQEEFYATR